MVSYLKAHLRRQVETPLLVEKSSQFVVNLTIDTLVPVKEERETIHVITAVRKKGMGKTNFNSG